MSEPFVGLAHPGRRLGDVASVGQLDPGQLEPLRAAAHVVLLVVRSRLVVPQTARSAGSLRSHDDSSQSRSPPATLHDPKTDQQSARCPPAGQAVPDSKEVGEQTSFPDPHFNRLSPTVPRIVAPRQRTPWDSEPDHQRLWITCTSHANPSWITCDATLTTRSIHQVAFR